MLPREEEAKLWIKNHHGGDLNRMFATGKAVVAMFEVPTWTINKNRGIDRRTLFLMWALLAKSAKTFRAIHRLCEAGLTHDAGVLLRQLFETSMAVHWIMRTRTRHRARMFVAHGAIRREIMYREMERVRGLKRVSRKVLPVVAKLHAAATQGLTSGEVTLLKKHWSGLGGGLEEVTRKLGGGWHRAYSLVYRETSATAHVADALQHLSIDSDVEGVPAVDILPDADNLPRVPIVASLLLLSAAQRVDERFGLGFAGNLKKVERPRAAKP